MQSSTVALRIYVTIRDLLLKFCNWQQSPIFVCPSTDIFLLFKETSFTSSLCMCYLYHRYSLGAPTSNYPTCLAPPTLPLHTFNLQTLQKTSNSGCRVHTEIARSGQLFIGRLPILVVVLNETKLSSLVTSQEGSIPKLGFDTTLLCQADCTT